MQSLGLMLQLFCAYLTGMRLILLVCITLVVQEVEGINHALSRIRRKQRNSHHIGVDDEAFAAVKERLEDLEEVQVLENA